MNAQVIALRSASASDDASPYRKLDTHRREIRLLELQPGPDTEPIHCSLRCVSLLQNSLPSYETISYVWGDEALRGSIHVCERLVAVPASTEAVLRRMRYAEQRRLLWVDAVCINQRDIDERSSQVTLMNEIYGKTHRNLIWLGESDNEISERALSSIANILEEIKIETNDFHDFVTQIYADGYNFVFSETAMSAQIDWPAVLDYFSSPWFTRLWIVQEAALSDQSICYRGPTELPLENVLMAAYWIMHKYTSLSRLDRCRGVECAGVIFMYAHRRYGRHNILLNAGLRATTLSLLLVSLTDFDSHDPRDHVFGMLGLYQKYMMTTDIPPCLRPNYHAAISEVFRNAARLVMREDCNLDILFEVNRRPSRDPNGIPSWVPRWHHKYDDRFDHKELDASRFSADAGEQLDAFILDDPNDLSLLDVKGIVVATVSTTFAVTRHNFKANGVSAVKAFLSTVHDMSQATNPDPLNNMRLAHTLTTGLDGRGTQVNEKQSAVLHAAFRHSIFVGNRIPDLVGPTEVNTYTTNTNAMNYWLALGHGCFNRRFFTTGLGYIGLGPLVMQPGDVVAVLFGSSSPMVMRPLVSGKDEYELIGYCYVYGIMKGEAVQSHRARGKADTFFHIR